MMLGLAVAPVAAAPATLPPPPNLGQRLRSSAWAKVRHGLFLATVGLPFLAFCCTYWAANQTMRGRFRYHLRSMWAASLAWYVTPWTPWAWLVAGWMFNLWREPKRWISAREQVTLERACALLAAWQVIAPDFGWRVQAGMFGGFTVAGLAPFWWSRWWIKPDGPWWRLSSWRRPPPAVEGLSFQDIWEDGIAGRVDRLAGEFVEADDDAGSYLIRLDNALATEAATLDALAEKVAHEYTGMPYPRGSITLSNPPNMPSPAYLRVTVAADPTGAVSRITYFDGPTLAKDGRYLAGYTRAGAPVYGRLWRVGGGANFLAFGVPGSGKGGAIRIHLTEAALSPIVFPIGLDCKGIEGEDSVFRGGAGIPEIAAGMEFYAKDKDAWEVGFLMTMEILAARADRYGNAGQSKWYPDLAVDGYCDPLWLAAIDELAIFSKAFPKFKDKFGQMLALERSFGMGTAGTSQNGQAPEFFGITKIRSDWRGNGITYAGHPGDNQAVTAAQADWQLNFTRLPKGQWQFVLNKIDHGVSTDPVRWRYLPSAVERDHEGLDGTYGVAEEWMARRETPKLHPQDEDIYNRWMERLGRQAAPTEAPALPLRPADLAVTEPTPGVHVEEAPRLHLVPAQSGARTARELIPDVLRTAGRAMTRGEIAEIIGQKPNYVSGLLKEMEGKAVKRATTPKGEPGWTAAA